MREERTLTESELAAASANQAKPTQEDPYPGLYRRCRRSKLLKPLEPAGAQRFIEVDIIVASARVWGECVERIEGGWDEINIDGVILAERTIG